MRPFYFHPDALLEADQAADFYEEQKRGLGNRFIETLTDAINRIRRNPRLYQGSIEIIAVMHFKRKPGYWKNRLQ